MVSNTKKTAWFIFIVAVFLFILDLYFKHIALYKLFEANLLGEFLKFSLAKNYYIAFSIPLGGKILILLIISIISYLLYYFMQGIKKADYIESALVLTIIMGASSNLLDRFRYGYVVDYIDLRYFTVFNIADSMIVGGVILLLFLSYFRKS